MERFDWSDFFAVLAVTYGNTIKGTSGAGKRNECIAHR